MRLLGLMSGTSLDGLDIAYCDIRDNGFEILAAETYPYPAQWVERLSTLEKASAYQYCLANVELGHYIGQQVNRFREAHPGPVDAIASHGHTIFHQPVNRVATAGNNPVYGLTTQIGDGDAIAAETGIPVVYNFRTLDVALGGQGAPLVPIGDELLFGQYDACLNLGGIANISFRADVDGRTVRQAFDICPCNMALNYLARLDGKEYDQNGLMARSGNPDAALLARMDSLDYYRQPLPKTLGKEWFTDNLLPLLQCSSKRLPDMMRTAVEHIMKGHDVAAESVTISPNSEYAGKKLKDIPFRQKYGINIAKVIRGSKRILIPSPEEHIYPYDEVLAIGTNEEVKRFVEEINAEEDVQNISYETDDFVLDAFELQKGCYLDGKMLRDTNMRQHGCMVVGVERNGMSLMSPKPDFVFEAGDFVWLAGERVECEKMVLVNGNPEA